MKECRNLTVRHFKSSNVLDGRSGRGRSTLCAAVCLSVRQRSTDCLASCPASVGRLTALLSSWTTAFILDVNSSNNKTVQSDRQQAGTLPTLPVTHCMSLIVSDLPTNCRALTDCKKLFYFLLFKYSVNDVFLIICPTVLSRCHIATD